MAVSETLGGAGTTMSVSETLGEAGTAMAVSRLGSSWEHRLCLLHQTGTP